MTDCILRVRGYPFDVDAFLISSSFQPIRSWHEGDATRKGIATDSGFHVVVASSETDLLAEQIEGAIEFLAVHRDDFRRLASDPTLEMGLDFARHRKVPLAFAEFNHFSRAMVQAAAEWGLYLELSQYMVQEDDDATDA